MCGLVFMRVLIVADIHDAIDKVRVVSGIDRDLTLVAGDYTYRWSVEPAVRALEILAEGSPVYYIPGNMDPDEAYNDLAVNNAVQVHGRVLQFGSYYIAGLGYVGEAEARNILGRFRGVRPLIVLSHAPPHGTLDKTITGVRLGSRALREFVDVERPVLVAHGHVHEARGYMRLGETLIVNPGPLMRGYYALVDLDVQSTVELGRV